MHYSSRKDIEYLMQLLTFFLVYKHLTAYACGYNKQIQISCYYNLNSSRNNIDLWFNDPEKEKKEMGMNNKLDTAEHSEMRNHAYFEANLIQKMHKYLANGSLTCIFFVAGMFDFWLWLKVVIEGLDT